MRINKQLGQVVVEYVLLLVLAVSLAFLLVSLVVSRDQNNPGFLISKWVSLIQMIGADTPDDIQR
jgi:uncharacterized membrane protein